MKKELKLIRNTMKQNSMLKKFKEFLELPTGSKLRPNTMVLEDFNNKIKKHKRNSNLEEDNLSSEDQLD